MFSIIAYILTKIYVIICCNYNAFKKPDLSVNIIEINIILLFYIQYDSIINMLTLDFMVSHTPGTKCSMYKRIFICKKRKVNLLTCRLYYHVAILLISLVHNFIQKWAYVFVSIVFLWQVMKDKLIHYIKYLIFFYMG